MDYTLGSKNIFFANLKKKTRLDIFLKKKIFKYSRSKIKSFIFDKKVFVDGIVCKKPSKKIICAKITFIDSLVKKTSISPENIPLNVLYQDKDIVIIDKYAGIVMHPGNGHLSGTLLNAILYHIKESKHVPRAGIIHRLDKDTTGLLIVAKNLFSYKKLISFMKKRNIVREYEAIVVGNIFSDGYISKPIKRHNYFKTKMSVHVSGKEAITYYKVINRFSGCTHVKIKLKTGRTHQIRVHFLYINHPLIGDKKYFDNRNIHLLEKKCLDYIKKFPRQALHAVNIKFNHPKTNEKKEFHSALPKDMVDLIYKLHRGF
ncbi:RluA family pseudouridine synthase [Buchnera aphidicola (Chaitoregma tattakana)]|uniref:RluA family pseudouridine synthase n=1 Tax=Buchnera aphidicola TaxID=9 RepID=UPI0031B823A0